MSDDFPEPEEEANDDLETPSSSSGAEEGSEVSPDENDEAVDLHFPEEILFGSERPSGSTPAGYEEVDEKTPELSHVEKLRVADRLNDLPVMSPRQIEAALLERGYRGQDYARRAGAVLAYRHMQRLRREFVLDVAVTERSLRENYLFLGATGSGKTYLTEMLFRDILGVSTVVADVTRYSETGYIGDDVLMLISELFEAANQDRAWASCGIICLDEFDKLAASRSAARFAGEGTTKDVSGFGVQRGLLNLLSGTATPFPTDFGYSAFGQKLTMPLHNVMFIACGAFSGLKQVADLAGGGGGSSIGFLENEVKEVDDSLVSKIGFELMEDTRAFANYGILPELLGRFSRMVPFQPLSAEVLREILEDNVLRSYRKEFEAEGVELIVEEQVIEHIIESARRRETGARAVRAALVPHLEEAAFKAFGDGGGATVRLFVKKGKVDLEVSYLA